MVRISLPSSISRYVGEKGSITVDGVSLTVSALGGEPGDEYFEISLIPTTLGLTTLGAAEPARRSIWKSTSSPSTSNACTRPRAASRNKKTSSREVVC